MDKNQKTRPVDLIFLDLMSGFAVHATSTWTKLPCEMLSFQSLAMLNGSLLSFPSKVSEPLNLFGKELHQWHEKEVELNGK